jgi:molecular chaperone GrpE
MLEPQEIEDILERFRDWLESTSEDLDVAEVRALAERLAQGASEAESNGSVGLLQVVETMTALRHDLKRESKAVRSLREAAETALEGLHRATEQFVEFQQDAGRAVEQAVRPFVEKLIMLDELIAQAASSIDKVAGRQEEPIGPQLRRELEASFARLPRWRRVAAAFWHHTVCSRLSDFRAAARNDVEGLAEGVRMLRTRAAAALADAGIARMACVGKRVDPTTMRVVEVVAAQERPAETVIEEVRPGYIYQGNVIRCAEVRATRGG